MQAFAIARLDVGAEGIEVLWTWPFGLPLAKRGYTIQRIESRGGESRSVCETVDAKLIAILRTKIETSTSLGRLRLRRGPKFITFSGVAAKLNDAQDKIQAVPRLRSDTSAIVDKPTTTLANAAAVRRECFIQELTQPTDRVTISVSARSAMAVATARGKAVAASHPASGSVIELTGPSIDKVLLYTLDVISFTICEYLPFRVAWHDADVIAEGLTLPIKEADPALATTAEEFATAQARIVGSETLDKDRFGRMARTLRAPVGDETLGRSGARISLNRSDANQSYEEMPLDQQLVALVLHPRTRRVLGFGHHDRNGLTPGATYAYRVTGEFDAADLSDRVYDVHRVPAGTVLPAAFWIGDLGIRCQLPAKVVLAPRPGASNHHDASRRGIHIDAKAFDKSWLLPPLDSFNALLTLPIAVTALVLEVAPGHTFTHQSGGAAIPLPPGPLAKLTFPFPIHELQLAGTGTLCAVRLPSGDKGKVTITAEAGPVTFKATPLPTPPLVLTVSNLQQPIAVMTGDISESTPVPARRSIGFKLEWLPAPIDGIVEWPADIESGPPLDSIAFSIDHRTVTLPATFGPWEPINADDNLTFGSRGALLPSVVPLAYGCDLDILYPANRPRDDAGLTLFYSDVFGEQDPTSGIVRPRAKLGSHHQYRIRAVDAAGRIGDAATLSGVVRLEKRIPPPLPAGPQPAPGIDAKGHMKGPPGPRARAIIKGARGLTPADKLILGAHENVIILEWGWRQAERDLDESTSEFRVYLTSPADTVSAEIVAVTSAALGWTIAMKTELPLEAGELVGQWIDSGGYPFRVASNTAGTIPTIVVEHALLKPGAQPVNGPVVISRPLRPEHQRPAGWSRRVAVHPLTAADTYRHVFFDVLELGTSHPRDTVWVGVSAADAQSYVTDERTSGANANRPGNESGIVVCAVSARYEGQPIFSVPPPLGDVPELVTEEPTGRQVLVTLDLPTLLGGALSDGAPVVLERCGTDEILARLSVEGGKVRLRLPDNSVHPVSFANPGDLSNVLDTLNSTTPERLANRYLLHAIATAPDPSVFFSRPSADIVSVAPAVDRLPQKPGRFFYFVRAADALGHLSAGGALLPIVVRVPSVAIAATPLRRSLAAKSGTLALTVSVPADPETIALLVFAVIAPPDTMPNPQSGAEILRVPNRRDLYPHDGLRLRLGDGTLAAPTIVKALADADVAVETDGSRVAALNLTVTGGGWATLWCYGLTRDGQPSRRCGPFSQGVPA